MPTLIFVLAIICLASVWAMMLLIKNLIYICQPNEVLIFSGSHRRIGSGRSGIDWFREAAASASLYWSGWTPSI